MNVRVLTRIPIVSVVVAAVLGIFLYILAERVWSHHKPSAVFSRQILWWKTALWWSVVYNWSDHAMPSKSTQTGWSTFEARAVNVLCTSYPWNGCRFYRRNRNYICRAIIWRRVDCSRERHNDRFSRNRTDCQFEVYRRERSRSKVESENTAESQRTICNRHHGI